MTDIKRLDFGFITRFLQITGIPFDVHVVRQKIDALNENPALLFTEKLNALVKSIPGNTKSVRSTSSRQFDTRYCPALILLDGQWQLLINHQGELCIFSDSNEQATPMLLSELPVTLVIWLQATQRNYMSDLHEHITDSMTLIRNVALKRKRWVFELAVATMVINIFAVLTSMFAMQIYDRVVPTLAFNTLYTLVSGVTIVYGIDWLLKVLRAKILDYHSSKIDVEVSSRIFNHLLNVQIDKLPKSLGTLSAQVNGLESARQFFSSTVVFLLIDMPFAFFFLAVIGMIGGAIGWVYLGFFLVSITLAMVSQMRTQKLAKILMTRSNERLGIMVDTIKGSETIRSGGATQTFQLEWDGISNSISAYGLQQKSISSTTTNTSATLGSLAYAIAVVIGVHLISQGHMTMGSMVACSILGGRVLGPVGQAVGYLLQYENVRQSIQMVNSLLKLPLQRAPDQALLFPDEQPKSMSLESVLFKYSEKDPLPLEIQDLSFHAGERIAVLGNVGSGKSTFLKVAAGLYRPQNGRIRLGIVDMWELDPYYVARNIGYLPQSVDLFKGTLRSNLTMGLEVSDTRLMDVCEALCIDRIASQSEKGMDLPINEGGTGLSGGQRQLVGLARLVLNAPSIWLLDEPTASLDQATQQQVIASLQSRIRPSDIVLFATHNPTLAMEWSTRIIFMDKGKVTKDVATEQVEIRKKIA